IEPTAELRAARGAESASFKFFDDWVPMSDVEQDRVKVEGELVFAGYGVTAPEFRWDDFKGTDVKGKVLLLVVNDPPATPEEPELFGGKALTYYGRWSYKYEEAARQGAAGAILIHTTESAGYPFQVVQSSWTTERFDLPRRPADGPPLALKAWASQDAAKKILAMAGQDLAALQKAATSRDFKPVPLGVKISTEMEQKLRRLESPNVVGVLPGADAKGRNEYVIYTAHHDHLGICKEKDGDNICNGALDNATGVAGLLGIAEAMVEAAKTKPPKRSQVFLAVTAEEQGLLGALYYARNPIFPPAQTVANINMDGLNIIGPTRDMAQVGSGKSELDQVAAAVARARGLTLKPDQFPEQGFFYRSDQFAFAQVGIPALYFDNGLEVIGKPEGYGKQKADEYVANDYHQPSDEIKPDWDWRGAEQMAEYLFAIGWEVTNSGRWYEWSPTAEFRAAREASRKKTK
ncbi:MAG: M28 family metallopeptidase, partial [Candidatus Acidiferrales bacterium]